MVAPFIKFYGKFDLVFVLTQENAFYQSFQFKANRISVGSSKKRYQGFSKQPSFWEIGMFLCANHWKLLTFSILQLCNKFLENENHFQKNWSTIFQLKVPENASFPYKAAISEANVKTNRMRVQNGPITKNGVFSVTNLFF